MHSKNKVWDNAPSEKITPVAQKIQNYMKAQGKRLNCQHFWGCVATWTQINSSYFYSNTLYSCLGNTQDQGLNLTQAWLQ